MDIRRVLIAELLLRVAHVTQLAQPLTHAHRRHASRDPIVELTERLRHPVRWRLEHPLYAVSRAARRVGRGA
jgi:hypothetical protein